MSENLNILLAEDDMLAREMISEIIKNDGYSVTTAENGKQAFEIHQSDKGLNLIISDLNMPEMNGMELIKQVRKTDPDIPIIILTGNDQVATAMTAINNGASDYLLKDENIENTISYSIKRVVDKKKLLDQNKQLMNNILQKNDELEKAREIADEERKKADNLLLNILPSKVANELKEKGKVEPVSFKSVSVMFADLKGFTRYAWNLDPKDLVKQLERLFEKFDQICENHNIEKLKTIGDAYMCAAGIPEANSTHPVDICLAAVEFQRAIQEIKAENRGKDAPDWELRVGIHSGPVTAGVIGTTKFAYDVWGDAVNVASRLEGACIPGKILVSNDLQPLICDFFDCSHAGEMELKNRGKVETYILEGIKPELCAEGDPVKTNDAFSKLYSERSNQK